MIFWSPPSRGVFDIARSSCDVSYERIVWYRVPAGSFPPIHARYERCVLGTLSTIAEAPFPRWAHPGKATRTIFVPVSLEEAYDRIGMEAMSEVARAHHLPMTWMVGNPLYVSSNVTLYRWLHRRYGDDVEVERDPALLAAMPLWLSWYVPTVSVEGAGRERFPLDARRRWRESAFWGIAWNSHGVDGTYDEGAPWGSYCADLGSYKRPDAGLGCPIVAFEWTARDLTRGYLSDREDAFSTDPDDLRLRGGFDVRAGRAYLRRLIDAYDAAGEDAPLVVIAQQESSEESLPEDNEMLDALYGETNANGMRALTLAQAAAAARGFSGQPRAVAFPFIPGGEEIASPLLDGATVYPATIDYHDARVGMTFLAGHLFPERVFRYADATRSRFDAPLPRLPEAEFPRAIGASVGNGAIRLRLFAPTATPYGIALWSPPEQLGLSGPGVVRAGRAGAVVRFDLHPGENEIVVPCAACTGEALPYAL